MSNIDNNYVETLNDDELEYLCKKVGARKFKEIFKKNSKSFNKIKPGFQAKSLKDDDVFSLILDKKNTPFIKTIVNKEIDCLVNNFSNQYLSYAYAMAFGKGGLTENIELYFKLTGQPVTKEHLEQIHKKMKQLQEVEVSAENNECEEPYQEMNEDQSDVKDIASRAVFDDTDDKVIGQLQSLKENEYLSLCEITPHPHKESLVWLKRWADVEKDGKLVPFYQDGNTQIYFGNRDHLYMTTNEGKDQTVGSMGLWRWYWEENRDDEDKDYIKSYFYPDIKPIEVALMSGCTSVEDIIDKLKDGYHWDFNEKQRILFVDQTSLNGVLCRAEDYKIEQGILKLSAQVKELPVYKVRPDSWFQLKNGRMFYQSIFAGIPDALIQVKSQLDIVKDVVLSHVDEYAKNNAEGRKERSRLKNTINEYMNNLPFEDTIDAISKACECDDEFARNLLEKFKGKVGDYISGDTLSNEVIVSVIETNDGLWKRVQDKLRYEWEKENQALIDEAKAKLKKIENQARDQQIELDEKQDRDRKLAQEIKEKEKLAADIEKNVQRKIQQAKENVADFIANMTFLGESIAPTKVSMENPIRDSSSKAYLIRERNARGNDMEVAKKWSDIVAIAAENLHEAGVTEDYTYGLAAFFYASYIKKQPVLLIGPSANEIIEALSAAFSNNKYGILYCDGEFSKDLINSIVDAGEHIVNIVGLLSGGWMNHVADLFDSKDVFFIATHPYAEDVQVEPKSLYNYMLPLFTEVFVDKEATGQYMSVCCDENFETYESVDNEEVGKLPALSEFLMSSLMRNKIEKLNALMHYIEPNLNEEHVFLFLIFPYGYATMATKELSEVIKDMHLSKDFQRKIRFVLGDN